jgi:ABC-2 type transport system permease protein
MAFFIALFFTGLGTAIASSMEDFHGFQLIMNLLVMPLFFLSGALFPLQGLPKVLQTITALNPLSYGIDGMRATLINSSHFGLMTNLLVLGGLSGLILVIGGYLFSKIQA